MLKNTKGQRNVSGENCTKHAERLAVLETKHGNTEKAILKIANKVDNHERYFNFLLGGWILVSVVLLVIRSIG